MPEFKVFDLGLTDFKLAWDFQKDVFAQVKAGLLKGALIFCRHYPVITLGRSAYPRNIRVCAWELEKRGIEVYEIERGGDVTYHGPGQLVTYPIFKLEVGLRDIHLFLRRLEEVIIRMLGRFDISGERREGLIGVWVKEKKVASIGIAIKNWITFHGFSVNITADDLPNFSLIRPCGMDIAMASLESFLQKKVSWGEIKETITVLLQKEWFDDQSYSAGIRGKN